MADNVGILEHEILQALYINTSLGSAGQGTADGKFIPLFKRDYSISTIHFGTLVDIVNNPEKYSKNKAVQEIIIRYEDVNDNVIKYKWSEISNAIEVLDLNEQVIDLQKLNEYGQCVERKINLTKKGAIDYRTKFYYKEREKEISLLRSYDIQKRERWLKKNWLLVEILKYVIGGIIGAGIALAVT